MARTTRRQRMLGLALAVTLVGQPAMALREVAWNGGGLVIDGRWDGPVVMPMPGGAAGPAFTDGFSVAAGGTPIQDTPAGQAIAHLQAGEWLKAIAAIESLDANDDRLVLDANGVLRPLSSLKGALLMSMPEQAQRAFRRLNDPAAQARLDQVQTLADLGERTLALRDIVESYRLCAASAKAADELGDIRFEQGRFEEAAGLYRFAAEHHASRPDDAGLMAKRLFANARAGRWAAFDRLADYARFRHAETSVTLGGSDTAMPAIIDQLATLKTQRADPATPTRPAVAMPAHERPAFDRPLIDDARIKRLRAGAMQQRMTMVVDLMIKPVVTTDRDRVFTLALGSVARIDPATGSDLWRQGDPQAHADEIAGNNRFYQLQQGYHQALAAAGDTLFAVVPDADNPSRSRLIAYDTDTGDERWDLRSTGGSFTQHGIVGEPLVHHDRLYAVAQQPGNPQLTLLVIECATGGVTASLALGAAASDPNLGAPAELSPRLAMGQGHLFVLTNNGGMIAVDPADHTIAWAFTQNIRPSGMGTLRHRGQFVPGSIAQHTGDVVARNGLVVAKDTRSDTIHAFGEHDASPAWSVTTDSDSTIVHADDRHVYVLGRELVAYDLASGERVWWTPHAGERAGTPVFSDDACILAGSSRMTRVDLSTGKLTDYRDDLADPANTAVAAGLLLRVSSDRLVGMTMSPTPLPDQP